jgi:hypothetical protein
MTTKQMLLEKMVDKPLEFKEEDFLELVHLEDEYGDKQVTFEDLRQNLLRIYDMNDRSFLDASNPMLGVLGGPNRWSTKARQKKYYQKIINHFTSDPGNLKVVAEGDSWFQFPIFVKDLIDWLMDCPKLAIYSIAAAGDWMANMIYEGKYIEELSIHNPDIFLISAGGNDFIASNRLAIMVDRNSNCRHCFTETELSKLGLTEQENKRFLEIQKYINPEFYAFIWTLKTQYWILFDRLSTSRKFSKLKIITQGYDNVIPSFKRRWSWQYPWQYFVNGVVNTGQWLKRPLQIKGFNEGDLQIWIMRFLIFMVNQMFIDLATRRNEDGSYKFPNVFHIDCRNTAKGYHDWFDEIHLKSHVYKKIADTYLKCIFSTIPEKKVYKVSEEDAKQDNFNRL